MDATGHKARGLALLPSEWTPPYVLISASLAATIASSDGTLSGSQIGKRLIASTLSGALERLFAESSNGIVARSSAMDEDISARGLYKSVQTTFANFQTTGEAIREVWSHAAKLDPGAAPIPTILQTRIIAPLLGHLSNESRLRRDRRDWVVEMRGELSDTRASGLRALRADRLPLASIDLNCSSGEQLRTVLRRIAGAFTQPGRRIHLEWLWDGGRVWIVQCDEIAELRSTRPSAQGSAVDMPQLTVFRSPTSADADIPKVRCVAEYLDADLPHANLLLLRDPDIIVALSRGECPDDLMDDLARLANAGVVVRSDYAREKQDFEVLLPRTETEHSAEKLRDFLIESTQLLRRKGVAVADIAFLTHVFIPADAAAWSLAAPLSTEVRVDATYGLPDGLLYYSHDSYEVNLRREAIRRRIRSKDSILVCADDGTWRTAPLGAPWDWRSTLSDAELFKMANISKQLANNLQRPVETMFLIKARMSAGTTDVLPWVHRVEGVGPVAIPATESHFPGTALDVRSRGDFRLLREALADTTTGERLLIPLKPEAQVLHDESFLKSAIAEMRPERCTVDLAGSGLAHVFYELQRAAVQVRTADPLEPSETEPEAFDKLVRDLIPESIAARGERVVAYSTDGEQLSHLLKRKLIEEAFEVAGASSTNHLIEELGDVIDVLDALCTVSGADLDQVRLWAEAKRQERGGFARGVVLIETRDRSLEEALTQDTPDFSLSAELGAEVERTRRETRRREQVAVVDETEVPFDVPDADADPVRLVIDGTELHLRFQTSGVLIRRARRLDSDPNQLSLQI